MDNKKLEQLARSDYFDMMKELIEEEIGKMREAGFESVVVEEVALEALSREKAVRVLRGIISLIERFVDEPKEGAKRSFR